MKWDAYYKEVRSAKPFVWPDVQVARLVSKLNLDKNAKILDLGCGEGRNIRLLTESGYEVTGIDQSKHALDIVRNLYNLPSEKLICADAIESIRQLASETFNLVLCWGLMHYISNTSTALNEIHRVLKRSSHVIISFSSNSDKRETVDSVKKYFTQQDIENFMQTANLKVRDIGLIQNHFIKDDKVEAFYWVLAEKE